MAAHPAPPASASASATPAEAAQGVVSGAGRLGGDAPASGASGAGRTGDSGLGGGQSSTPRLPAPEAAAAPSWRPAADAPLGGRVERAREESPEWATPGECTPSSVELIALLQIKLLTYRSQ